MVGQLNHQEDGLALVISRYASDQRFMPWLATMLHELDLAESALFEIIDGQNLDTSVESMLDILGGLIGQNRGTLTDTEYRAIIYGRAWANSRTGGIDDVQKMLNLYFVPLGLTYTSKEVYPMSFRVEIDGVSSELEEAIGGLINRMKGGGVAATVVRDIPTANLFYYGGGPGFASSASAVVGGGIVGKVNGG